MESDYPILTNIEGKRERMSGQKQKEKEEREEEPEWKKWKKTQEMA